MKADLSFHHAFWNQIQIVLEWELVSATDEQKETIQNIRTSLKNYYDSTQAISKKIDDIFKI